MSDTAKTYINGVIGSGVLVLAYALAHWSSASLGAWAVFTALAVLASIVKLRLPGMEGTYSFSFLFLLYGVAHFSLSETLIAGCAAGAAQSLLRVQKRPVPIQVFFNIANLIVSAGVCFLVARVWLAAGIVHYLPAVMALLACVYFVVNTVLVSGVLALLENKPLGDVFRAWYVWSFPYYLVGVVLVGLVPAPGYAVSGEAWLALLPAVYLVHFFLGLVRWQASLPAGGGGSKGPLPRSAQVFVGAVVTACAILLALAAAGWQSENPARFAVYLALAALASTFKIQLPRTGGTITPAFVLLLVAISQLSFAETLAMAMISGLVQVLWRSVRRPAVAQVLFSPASLVVSAALARSLGRFSPGPWPGHSVVGELVVAALVLFGSNTLLVATVLALVERKPLSAVWQNCYFWSLPYYLVGAAAAGLMTAVNRTADWGPSLLILPLMALVFLSYRAQLSLAVSRQT